LARKNKRDDQPAKSNRGRPDARGVFIVFDQEEQPVPPPPVDEDRALARDEDGQDEERDHKTRAVERRRSPMAKQINCECGAVIRGESEDEVIAGAESHVRQDHPELVGKVSRDELQSWVQDA
jgi:predicted small metal-binding protein